MPHQYLFTILRSYGLTAMFLHRIRNMYENVNSSVQINGHNEGPIPIRCFNRQGCPLSMVKFALCINTRWNICQKSGMRSTGTEFTLCGGESLCWWRHDICDKAWWFPRNTRSDAMLWESVWGTPKIQEFPGSSRWGMGQICKRLRCGSLHVHKNITNHFQLHERSGNAWKLDTDYS